MKIRTDFVTNSSSSSFSVALTITDKSGKPYALEFYPYALDCDGNAECSFSGNLERLSIKAMLSNIQSSLAAEYEVKESSREARADRNALIENLKVGDCVDLVMTANGIEVRSNEGSLGLLPADAARIIRKYANEPYILFKAVVSSVTPLSARSKSARIALLSVSITAEAKDGRLLLLNSVEDLCRMLVNMIHVSVGDYWDDEDCEYDEDDDFEEYEEEEDFEGEWKQSIADVAAEKEAFVKKVTAGIRSVEDIASITVQRDYSAWGEFADLVADNDRTLCTLAKKVLDADEESRPAAMREMEAYIHTSNPERFCESFGEGYEDFRYAWIGDDKALLDLAKRLHSGYGPGEVNGTEVDRLDLTTGECTSYAEFMLS